MPPFYHGRVVGEAKPGAMSWLGQVGRGLWNIIEFQYSSQVGIPRLRPRVRTDAATRTNRVQCDVWHIVTILPLSGLLLRTVLQDAGVGGAITADVRKSY